MRECRVESRDGEMRPQSIYMRMYMYMWSGGEECGSGFRVLGRCHCARTQIAWDPSTVYRAGNYLRAIGSRITQSYLSTGNRAILILSHRARRARRERDVARRIG